MTSLLINRIVGLFVLTCIFWAAPFTASAYVIEQIPSQDVKSDFVVGPGKIELEIAPGESKTFNLTVTNRMGDDRIFTLSKEDFKGSDNLEETVVLLGEEQGPYSLRDLISVPEDSFELKHAERAVIPVTVSVPADAEPGGLYGSIITDTASKRIDGQQARSTIVSRIATLIFVRIPGEVNAEGKLSQFTTLASKKLYGGAPIPFTILYENTGSVHLTPYGFIEVKNMFGREVGNIPVDAWFAMPDALRSREISWEHPTILFGKYTATAKINRGYGGIVDEMKFTFYVFPIKLFVLIVGALAFVLIVFKWLLSNFEFRRK